MIKGCNDNICQGRISFFAQCLFIFNNSTDGECECRRERQVVWTVSRDGAAFIMPIRATPSTRLIIRRAKAQSTLGKWECHAYALKRGDCFVTQREEEAGLGAPGANHLCKFFYIMYSSWCELDMTVLEAELCKSANMAVIRDFCFLLMPYRCLINVQRGPVCKFTSMTWTVSRADIMHKQCAFYCWND